MKYVLFAVGAILTSQFAQAQISDADKAAHAAATDVKSVEDTIVQIEHDVKRAGHWQAVASHESNVSAPK